MFKKNMLRVLACVMAVLMLMGSFAMSVSAAGVQTGKLKVEVTGGAGFYISLDGAAARPQGAVYLNSKITVGTTVTVSVKEISGSTFVGWVDPMNGTIISDALSYTFVASGNDYINAMYASPIDGVQRVMFKNTKSGSYGKIMDMQYYTAEDEINFPLDPTQVGYDFAGWSMTEAEIKEAIAKGQDVEVVANWTRQNIPVQVEVIGGEGSGSYNANSAVTVVANEATEGEKFAYWTDSEGNIKSYNETYKFFPSKDTTVTAVFVAEDTEIDYQILVGIDSIDTTSIETKNVFYYSWYCPEGYDFVKAGILAVNKDNYKEDTFVAGTDDSNVYDRSPSGTILREGSTSWSKSNVTPGQTWVAKAYVQYRNAQGNIVTVYSEMVEATK